MILVDSSVWISNLRDIQSEAVGKLRRLLRRREEILIGDLILMEVLMGARDEAHALRLQRELSEVPVVAMSDASIAEEAARNFRALRRLGFTVRTGIDLIVGTYCIRHGHALLHDDRDFRPMEQHLGLLSV